MTADPSTSTDPTTLLARTNLLRLETAALLSESTLHVHPPQNLSTPHLSEAFNAGEERAHYEVKWSPAVRRYLHHVNDALANINGEATVLSPDVCGAEGGHRVPLQSDKFRKHVASSADGNKDGEGKWEFPAPKSLTLAPVGSFSHLGNAGLAGRHANGNCVPVLDVAALIGEGFVGGKDYLNGRYGDKRNILAVHIAKLLSQKKHRSKIGAVHLTPVFGDSSKIGLLLTPPDAEKTDKKRKKTDKKPGKLRFRIRLLFGTEGIASKKHREYSDDDDDEEEEAWNCWIPRSRLFPDRSNRRSEKRGSEALVGAESGTPHYTNSMAEDLHYVSTSNLISNAAGMLTGEYSSNATPASSAFHETLILLKVWALQRGFLRGHDSFTTTTLAVLLVYLYRTKQIGRRMGSMQAFTAFMKFWSEVDWLGEDSLDASACVPSGGSTKAEVVLQRKVLKKAAFVIPEEGRNESQTIDHCEQARLYLKDVRENSNGIDRDHRTPKTLLDSFRLHYTSSSSAFTVCNSHHDSPILLDPTMTINYLARLSPSFVRESRAEAHAALRCVHGHEREEVGGGAFRKLFLETNRFWTRYDAYLRIPLGSVPRLADSSGKKKGSRSKGGKGDVPSSDQRVWGKDADDLGYNESVCRGVVEVLSLALGDRVSVVRALTCGNGDIRGSLSAESADEVATKCITDSDETLAVPVRGTDTNRIYNADSSMRSAQPPVLTLNQHDQCLVVAMRIDPNASRRVVDRGPPAEDVEGSAAFVALWGEAFAQLRRFQDGAIVRAVVWNSPSPGTTRPENVRFSGDDKFVGGIVEKVAQHIVKLHFGKSGQSERSSKPVAFELRNMVSFIDGVSSEKPSPFSDSSSLHKSLLVAFESLSDFLRRNSATTFDTSAGKGKKASKLGLPLSIDEVEPLSPCLRYSSLFPPVPHPLLGGVDLGDKRKVSGVVDGEPILIQIRFEGSSKWPSSLNAMGAAKCAMLIQLADGIQKMKDERSTADDIDAFDGPMDVTPNHLTIGYRGYSFKIIVRADQELRMLKGLKNPTDEAKKLRLGLINRHVRGSMHHSLIHAIHTRHPSASAVVRLASRWIASHLLSDIIPHEAIELIVAKVYTESKDTTNSVLCSVNAPPSTVMAGFLKFLQLLFTHDWARDPLIVDPQSHISSSERSIIYSQFNSTRGPDYNRGPAMWIISPADYDGVEEMTGSKVVGIEESAPQTMAEKQPVKIWSPTITAAHPERVVLARASALAKCSHDHLVSCIVRGDSNHNNWVSAFKESSVSLTSYSALLRVHSSFIVDTGCSSTEADCAMFLSGKSSVQDSFVQSPFERSMQRRFDGPKELRKKHYKNLVLANDTLHEWNPVKSLVTALRSNFNQYAVFFYNQYCPDVIAMLWRPSVLTPQPFSAMVSEFQQPVVMNSWKEDTLVVMNKSDLLHEIGFASKEIITGMKIFGEQKQHDVVGNAEKRYKSPKQYEEVEE